MVAFYAPAYFGLGQVYEQKLSLEDVKQNYAIAVQLDLKILIIALI